MDIPLHEELGADRAERSEALAGLARAAREPNRILDGLIFRTLDDAPGAIWSDDFEDDVWHRRDPEDSCAWDGPPAYMSSIDAADRSRAPGMRLLSLRERLKHDMSGPDWRSWACDIEVSALNLVLKGEGHSAPAAMMDAILQAHACTFGDVV